MSIITIQPVGDSDRDWVSHFLVEHWGDTLMVVHGHTYHPHTLPGFIALHNGERVGLLTYTIEGMDCEIVSIDSTRPSLGIGTALIEAIKDVAFQAGCQRLWLITTNDNLKALRFYQKRGFSLVAVHRNAVTESRKIKPSIPLLGDDNIPIRDEIELEMLLAPAKE